MVQLFYHEHRGKSCRKLLKHDGYPNKLFLHPCESWAHPSGVTYWMIKTPWWSKKKCKVIEVNGTQKYTGKGKMVDTGKGQMVISGKMKDNIPSGRHFKLILSSDVSNEDFQMGYCMTGTLERASEKKDAMETTHFAVIKRKGY